MGQQQLLLLVLGIVIVGIAVVAGIQAFSEGKAKAEQDAAVSDAMRIISDIQAWKLKPTAFGGGAEKDAFEDVNFNALGYPVEEATEYATYNGCYQLPAVTAGGPAVIHIYQLSEENSTIVSDPTPADPSSGDEVMGKDCITSSQIATVTVEGSGTDQITWTYN